MKKVFISFLAIALAAGLLTSNAAAQGTVGKQRTFSLSIGELAAIAGKEPQQAGDLESMSGFVFSLSVDDLLRKARGAGITPVITEMTLYVSGKKVRFDVEDRETRMSHIMQLDEGKIYNIMWGQKQYMEISRETMKQMEQQAKAALERLEGMQGMEGMLEHMPPEARAQWEAATESRAKAGKSMQLRKTGNKKTIRGHSCEEYRVEGPATKRQVWVTGKYPALRRTFESLSSEFPGFEGPGKKDREWEAWDSVPDAWPMLLKQLDREPFTMELTLEVMETLSIEEKALPPDTFRVPTGFTKVDMGQMLRQGMQGR